MENLVRCNNCDNLYCDTNPGEHSVEVELETYPDYLARLEDENGEYVGCPVCDTDDYLSDITEANVAEAIIYFTFLSTLQK